MLSDYVLEDIDATPDALTALNELKSKLKR